jgi:ribokinase
LAGACDRLRGDLVVQTEHLPRLGETVLGGTFLMNPGGKGANQAVAAARLGGEVVFVCKTGQDLFGQNTRQILKKENMDTTYVLLDDEQPSGVALITVDEKGENCIAVASGANAHLLPEDLMAIHEVIEKADIVLMQLEIPLETVEYVADEANRMGKRVVLNPAPARELPESLLCNLSMITPNETEASLLSGAEVTDEASAVEAARTLTKMGVKRVVITLGSKGALSFVNGKSELIRALKVKAVDTTAAGDVFNGALVVALAEGMPLSEAIRFANKASAISVTRAGAQASIPNREELD